MRTWKFYLLGIVCSILPDADVLSFRLGIPYDHLLGHRGFTHSIVFAVLSGLLITFLFYRKELRNIRGLGYILFFFLSTISHSILDAFTTGGLGVAFFAPFDNTRYFFPWRAILVSPIGVGNFFSEWGWRVIKSELFWIGLPCAVYVSVLMLFSKRKSKSKS